MYSTLIITFLIILIYIIFSVGFIESLLISQNKIDSKNKFIFNYFIIDYWLFYLLFLPGFLIYRVLILDFKYILSKKKILISIIVRSFISISILVLGTLTIIILWKKLIFVWRFAVISWLFFYFLIGYYAQPAFKDEANNTSKFNNINIIKISLDGSILFFLPWFIIQSIIDLFNIKSIKISNK